MRAILAITFLALAATSLPAKNYRIDAPEKFVPIHGEHLHMGGNSPDGGSIEVNNFYIVRDGKPVIPVMGEFHYTRYPAEQWEQEIMKMKAGGVNILPTYIFWSLHEENEGEWNWSGNRDLRHFVELCKKHDMDVIVRIGPFGHGEIRSGAIPDWIFAKNLDIRSDDPRYLAYAEKLYNEIARQIDGLYYKEGGPVIGCQIENEHQHSAAPWAINYSGEPVLDFTAATYDKGITKLGVSVQEDQINTAELGDRHMLTLLGLAQKAGIDVPFYTATGWGNAAVLPGKAIPVTSGYTYPTWFPNQRMSDFCMFKNIWAEPDYSPVRYNSLDYPSASAEMGVGIQMVYDKRPICTPEAAEALMIRSLGGGSNILGYYMYHGGTTPSMKGNGGLFSDQPMGLPKFSYDFQAPLGEFGIENASYRTLRVLHNFLADFGDRLAPMQPVMPENVATMTPDNRDDLRYAMRVNPQGQGFLFLTNSQDHDSLRYDFNDVSINVNLPGESLRIPSEGGFTLPKYTSAILPFNFPMESALLKYATAQPMSVIDDNGTPHYFFMVHAGMDPQYAFDPSTVKGKSKFTHITPGFDSTFKVKVADGKTFKVTTLDFATARNAMKIDGKMLFTDATVTVNGDSIDLYQRGNNSFGYITYPSKQGFRPVNVTVEAVEAVPDIDKSVAWRMEVKFDRVASATPQVNEYFLSVPYTGDLAMAFLDNEMILDHFWQGASWTIGLNRYADKMGDGKPMGFYFRPLRGEVPYLDDIRMAGREIPDLSDGPVLNIGDPVIIPEYTTAITL